MRKWLPRILLLLVVLTTATFVLHRTWLEPRERERVRRAAGELGDALRAEVDAFDLRTFEREALPGDPVEGDAIEHYRAACALMEESGVDRDLLYHVDAEDPETPGILERLAPAFAKLEAGTRARMVGVFLPVRRPGEAAPLAAPKRLVELLLMGAALDFEAGRPAEALRRVEVALRAGRDLTMAQPFAVERRLLCERPIEVLGDAVAHRRLGPAERTRAIALLMENLTQRPPAWAAYRPEVLRVQLLLADYFAGRVTYADLATELALAPRENRWLGFVREGPTDRDLYDGWLILRALVPDLRAEAEARPDTVSTYATKRLRELSRPEGSEAVLAVVGPGLMWGTIALSGKGKKLAEEQAVLIALRLLEAEAATGAMPTDLAGLVDEAAEPRQPDAAWALRKDDLGRLSLFHEIPGKTTMAEASRLVPVFSFR
jgi:hypothetical protein